MKPDELNALKRRAAELLAKPDAVDASGLATVASVMAFFEAAGLDVPRPDCYWTVQKQ